MVPLGIFMIIGPVMQVCKISSTVAANEMLRAHFQVKVNAELLSEQTTFCYGGGGYTR